MSAIDRPASRRARIVSLMAVAAILGCARCAPAGHPPPQNVGAGPPIAVERLPGTAGDLSGPGNAQARPGPIALAPGMTGAAVPPPAAPPAPPRRAPMPPPVAAAPAPPPRPAPSPAAPPPAAPAAPPPVPTEAAAAAPGPLAPCPPGEIAMWSRPDVAGTPVSICRRLAPLR